MNTALVVLVVTCGMALAALCFVVWCLRDLTKNALSDYRADTDRALDRVMCREDMWQEQKRMELDQKPRYTPPKPPLSDIVPGESPYSPEDIVARMTARDVGD